MKGSVPIFSLPSALRLLADLFFPPKCLVCGDIIRRKRISRCFCPLCFEKFLTEQSAPCPECRKAFSLCSCRPENFLPSGFAYALPYGEDYPASRRLLLNCKSRENRDAFGTLAERTAAAACAAGLLSEESLITFVPRSPQKVFRIGHDQARVLSKGIASETGLPSAKLLRHRLFSSEQKTLNRKGREENACRSYALSPFAAKKLRGRPVLLVDDIVTSGATVNACTSLLISAGAQSVVCLSAARRVGKRSSYK